MVADRGRDRRRGPPRSRQVGSRGRGPFRRRRRAEAFRCNAEGSPISAAVVHQRPVGDVRALRGRDARRRRLDGAFAALGAAEPRPARPARRRPRRGKRLSPRRSADRSSRRFRAPDPGLAGLRLAPVLAAGPRLPAAQRTRRTRCASRAGSPTWTPAKTSRRAAFPRCCAGYASTAGCTTSRGSWCSAITRCSAAGGRRR